MRLYRVVIYTQLGNVNINVSAESGREALRQIVCMGYHACNVVALVRVDS